jgi:hypothetical protein
MKEKLNKLFNFIMLANSSVSRGYTFSQNNYLKFLGTGYYMAYFFFNKKKAKIESKKFAIKAEFELCRQVWNLMDTRVLKHALKGLLAGIASIKYRKKLFFKKESKEITMDYIRSVIDSFKKGNNDNNINKNMIKKNELDSHYTDHIDSSSSNLENKLINNENDITNSNIKSRSNSNDTKQDELFLSSIKENQKDSKI